MRIKTDRMIVAASLLGLGLVAWSGCNAENPDGTKTNLGKAEDKVIEAGKKIEAGAEKVGTEIKEGARSATDATGRAIENAGEKLETSGKEATEKHVGEKAGSVVGKAGEALDKAGEKIQESVKKKD